MISGRFGVCLSMIIKESEVREFTFILVIINKRVS